MLFLRLLSHCLYEGSSYNVFYEICYMWKLEAPSHGGGKTQSHLRMVFFTSTSRTCPTKWVDPQFGNLTCHQTTTGYSVFDGRCVSGPCMCCTCSPTCVSGHCDLS